MGATVARSRRQRYFGKLAEPVGLAPSKKLLPDDSDRLHDTFLTLYSKLPDLAAWYGIQSDKNGEFDYRMLCVRLAHDQGIPGFQIKESPRIRGRTRTNFIEDWQLLRDVAEIQSRKRRLSVLASCKLLTKSRKGPWFGKNPATLQVRHSEHRRHFKKKFGYEYGSLEHRDAWAKSSSLKRELLAD
jgi:hypothetical protein